MGLKHRSTLVGCRSTMTFYARKVMRIAIAALLTAQACAVDAGSWVTAAEKPGRFFNAGTRVEGVFEISDASMPMALSTLSTVSAVRISKQQAQSLIKGDAHALDRLSGHISLVRALRSRDDGAFTAYQLDDSLLVIHGALGQPGAVRRTAVVVVTERPVTRVFGTYGSAQ